MSTFGPEPAEGTNVPQAPRSTPETTWAAQRPSPAPSATGARPTLGQALVMGAGVLLLVWSFLPWYSDSGGSANAWSTNTIPGLVLTATWVPLLSLAIAGLVALKTFGHGLPDKALGFTWIQLSLVVGLFDVLITFGLLVANRSVGDFGSLSLGVGLILSFITALAMLAGGILDHIGVGTDVFRRPQSPSPAG